LREAPTPAASEQKRVAQNLLRSLSATGRLAAVASEPSLALGYRKSNILARPKPHLTHKSSQYYRAPYDTAYAHVQRERTLAVLENLFYEADEDGSAGVTLEEFRQCTMNLSCQKAFAQFGVQPHQAEMVYRALDKTKEGNLTIDQFMTGFIELIGHEFSNDQFELDIESLKPGRKRDKNMTEKVKKTYVRTSSAPQLYPEDCFRRPLHVTSVPPQHAPPLARVPLRKVRPGVRCIVGELGVC
jgi:hypothetical protein